MHNPTGSRQDPTRGRHRPCFQQRRHAAWVPVGNSRGEGGGQHRSRGGKRGGGDAAATGLNERHCTGASAAEGAHPAPTAAASTTALLNITHGGCGSGARPSRRAYCDYRHRPCGGRVQQQRSAGVPPGLFRKARPTPPVATHNPPRRGTQEACSWRCWWRWWQRCGRGGREGRQRRPRGGAHVGQGGGSERIGARGNGEEEVDWEVSEAEGGGVLLTMSSGGFS